AERLLGCRPVRADARCRERWRDSAVHGGRVDDGSVDDGPPMLLLHSEGDFVPAAHSREVAAALPGVTVRVLPGDAHGVALLELPGVASEVLAWLDARTGDRSGSVASGPSRPQSRERAWIVPTPGQTP
ncbi:alpha/beta hydrolase family protein, partial [Streptomyces sparsus]